MAGYHMHEALLELAPGWMDQSVNVFARELEPGIRASFIVTRDKLDVPLETYVSLVLKGYRAQFSRFALVSAGALTAAGQPAWGAAYTWRQKGIEIYQRQIYLPATVPGLDPTQRVLVFTVSAPVSHRKFVDAEIDAAREGLKLRKLV